MHNDMNFRCRVCGLLQGDPPWGEDGTAPTFEICDCCGVEFGYEDSTVESVRRYRKKWNASPGKWFAPKKKPAQWSLEDQLKHIPKDYR